MKLKTSSCKAVAFRKDITRFLPVWALYALYLMFLQITLEPGRVEYWYAANIAGSLSYMAVVNLIYGFVAAQALFGDLFQSRMCNGLHALPLKREQWFGIHVGAGMLYSLIPTALMALFCQIVLLTLGSTMVNAWQIPLLWWVVVNLQYLFFFSLAVVCVLYSGSRLGSGLLYGIANFLSALLFVMIDRIYVPMLFGVVVRSDVFTWFSPVIQLDAWWVITTRRTETGNTYINQYGERENEYIGTFQVEADGCIYLAVLVVIAVVLLILARQIYKKRKLECAGDLLAVRWLEPVFQVLISVLGGIALDGLYWLFLGYTGIHPYPLLFLGLVVGWFAGRMLLERSIRVFRLKNILGCGLVAGVMAVSLFLTGLDPLNVSGWIPQAEDLQRVTLSTGYGSDYTTEDPEEIRQLIRLQELALEEKAQVHPDYTPYNYNPNVKDAGMAFVSLHYYRENGIPSFREYYISAEGAAGEILREYASRPEMVFVHSGVKSPEDLRSRILQADFLRLSGWKVPQEQLTEEFLSDLADALIADCEDRNMVQMGAYHPEPVFRGSEEQGNMNLFYLDVGNADRMAAVTAELYSDCVHTMALLEETGILEQLRQGFE